MKIRISKPILLTICLVIFTAIVVISLVQRSWDSSKGVEALPKPSEVLTEYSREKILSESQRFDSFTTCLVPRIIQASPLSASFKYGDLKALGLEGLLSELDQLSPKAFQSEIEFAKSNLEQLEAIDDDLLSTEQKSTYDMLVFQNSLILEGEPFQYYGNMLEPSSGIQMNLPLSLIQIELKDESEVQAFLQRLSQIPRLFSQIEAYENLRASEQLTMPPGLYQPVLDQIDGLLVPPEDFMIYLDFSKKIHEMKSLDEAKKAAYLNQCLTLIRDDIYPAYEQMRLTVKNIMALSKTDLGVCSWKNGHEYYEYIIHRETSYNMSAESLRSWALEEKTACISEIKSLCASNPELLKMDLAELMPKYDSLEDVYAIEDQCLDEMFYDYDIDRADEFIIPPYLEDYVAAGFYFPVSIDGIGYGNMYLQEGAYTSLNASTLELYFHENIPGHHMYFSKFFASDLPLIRKVSTWLPYEEGWAQYIQNVSIHYFGLSEPLTKLLKASSKLSYYSMLLVDLNYHYDGISETDALNAYIALGYSKDSSQKAVNRMIAHPGEIIHYIYGGYKIESYLKQCQDALGNNFNIKAFHDMILNHAELPFTTMDQIVPAFIKDQQ